MRHSIVVGCLAALGILGCAPTAPSVPTPSASPVSAPAIQVGQQAATDEDVSVATLNGKQVLYQTATLIVAPIDQLPDTIQKILDLYGGLVVSQVEQKLYLIQFDLDRVDLTDLEESVRALNQVNNAPIQTANFQTVDAAKTFKLFADLVTRHGEWVDAASLNTFTLTP